ncbi:hypothetical protein SteCoe_26131 [Stentor coeruleus]|uniref:WWE domain-containing protein n=1 Tax=Stentor coeruleus TaxID=5963 RepID=A0A1R2BDL5_9CILI|nr:hypothetical protein SteCoe_26131 [Stentor coeruleus]
MPQSGLTINLKAHNIICDPYIAQSLHSNNIPIDISKKYKNCKIMFKGNGFLIHAISDEDIQNIDKELKEFIDKMTIDPNARWAFLNDDGSYKDYAFNISTLIEDTYKQNLYELIIKEYTNYSLSVRFNVNGQNFEVQFAQVGGIHRQINLNKNMNIPKVIRAVKRYASNERINQDFIRKYRWEWLHESNVYRPYEDDANYLIEMSYIEYMKNGNPTMALIQGNNFKTYKIDFNEYIQANEVSDFKRYIRRITLP